MFGRVGPSELIFILIVALIVIGPNKLPEFGKSLGKGIREFRKSMKELQASIEEEPSRVEKKE